MQGEDPVQNSPNSLAKKGEQSLEKGDVHCDAVGTQTADPMASECKPLPEKVESPIEAVVTLRGTDYVLRRLRPDDEKRLQDFFYSHSQETIQLRYGYMISTMTH